MKKTFYYNFLPTKAEEEAAAAAVACKRSSSSSSAASHHQVTRTLVEITDIYPPPCIDPINPWKIRKFITSSEIACGMLSISQEDMLEHVFRYWTLEMANQVVKGNACLVILIDYTREDMVRSFRSENSYVTNGPKDTYLLGFMDVIRLQQLNPGEEIGLFWDRTKGAFGFKIFRRRSFPN